MADRPYLELQAVDAWLGSRLVFRDLSLRLLLGQHTVILGPNGSGKSSLVRLLCRELYPVVQPGSSLRIFGEATVNLWELRRRIGVLSSEMQTRHGASCRARDVVTGGLFGAVGLGRHHQVTSSQQRQVDALLQQLRLQDLAERCFGELSDGQRRRLLLARAMVHRPELLVLDEPSTGLDLRARHQLLTDLRQLAGSGTTLLLITHDIDAIIPEIERVLMLREGRLLADGPIASTLHSDSLSRLFETPLQLIERDGWRQVLPA